MKTRNVYIARHGHREDFVGDRWSAEWRSPRLYDPGLSEIGVVQARELGERLRDYEIRHLFASPFLRTVQTAHYCAQALGLSIKIEEGICEWLNPAWFPARPELLSPDQLAQRFPRIDLSYRSRLHRTFPEQDDAVEVWPRIAALLEGLLHDFEGDLLFIGHGSSAAGLAHALGGGNTFLVKMCALMHFQQESGGWRMLLDGCTRHLSVSEDELRFH